MGISFNRKYAFTLAEVGIVFLIIGIVVLATMKISSSRKDYEKEAMYYSTFTNLKTAVAEMLAQGCTSSNTTTCPTQKELPTVAHTTTNDNGTNPDGSVGDGFCDRLANNFNTIGTINCTIKTLNGGTFNKAATNFITTNSLRFFNFGSDPLSGGPFGNGPDASYYDIFVDINGPKGNATQTGNNADIMEFWIGRDGVVVPAPSQGGAVDRTYLTTSVRYLDSSTDKYVTLLSGVTFKEAACKAGKINTAKVVYSAYCDCPHDSLEGTCTTSYTRDAHCPVNNNTCNVVINRAKL